MYQMFKMYYFKPVMELKKQQDIRKCLSIHFVLYTYNEIILTEDGTITESIATMHVKDRVNESPMKDDWLQFLLHLETYEADHTLVLFTSAFPHWVVDTISKIQSEKRFDLIIAVTRYPDPWSFNFRKDLHQRFAKFYEKLRTSQLDYYIDISPKDLWDTIKAPKTYNHFDVVRNLNFSINTNCFTNKTLNVVYEPTDDFPIYDANVITFLVFLESIFIVNNFKRDNRLRIVVTRDWTLPLHVLRGRHEFQVFSSEEKYLSTLPSLPLDRNKSVFLNVFTKKTISRGGNVSLIVQELRSKHIPIIELIRDSEQNLPVFRHEDSIYTKSFSFDSPKLPELLLDTLIDVGCT